MLSRHEARGNILGMFIQHLFTDPFFYFSWILVVMFSISLHEYAHARAAYAAGDTTAWFLGHFSLNPWVQMGPQSLVMLSLFGIAWGAVPVSRAQLVLPKTRAQVAFAGPAANLLLVCVFSSMAAAMDVWWPMAHTSVVMRFIVIGGLANAMLFVLNMLPVPVLDGWEVFALIFPGMRRVSPAKAQQWSWIAILIIFITPVGDLIWSGARWLYTGIGVLWRQAFSLFGL